MNGARSECYNLLLDEHVSCAKRLPNCRSSERMGMRSNIKTLNSQNIKKASDLLSGNIPNNPTIEGQSVIVCLCVHCTLERRRIIKKIKKPNDLPFTLFTKPVSYIFRIKPTHNEYENA